MSTLSTLNDPSEVVPVIGMEGIYSLKAPYANLLLQQVVYTCIAVKSLTAALLDGEDPLHDVYIAQGDSQQNYDADLAAGRCLVVLQSSVGEKITVPTSAIAGLPGADGVRYTSHLLGISLSALPEGFDLTGLQEAVEDLVLTQVGVASTSVLTTVGPVQMLSHTAHASVEAAREAQQDLQPSKEIRINQLVTENTALKAKIAQLEAWILAHP